MPTTISPLLDEVYHTNFVLMAMKGVGGKDLDIKPIPDGKCDKCGNTTTAYKTHCVECFSKPVDLYILPWKCCGCKKKARDEYQAMMKKDAEDEKARINERKCKAMINKKKYDIDFSGLMVNL